jgi:sugar phosphate isomerase/epimerase
MPGDGQIDLRAEIKALREMGYNGTVSLELFNKSWWDRDPQETLRVGLQRMRELFEEE